MAIHVRDPETDALVRELARKRGVSLTEAVRQAVGAELGREVDATKLRARIQEIQAKVLSRPPTGLEADKAFYDWLSGEED